MKLPDINKIEIEKGTSLWSNSWYRLKQNRLAMVGLVILIFMILISLLTPLIAPYSYEVQDLNLGAVPPSTKHWLGTDIFGRDMLTRIMYGSQVSLAVGFLATAVSLIIGVAWGTVSGFSGGRIDATMMRIVDILYALPFIIFVILLMVVFGRNLFLLFMAIGAVEWLTMARIIRGQVLSIREKEYIDSAIMTGISKWRIITRHVIPNTIGPIIVYTTLTIPSVILLESFLSFLGLGIQPPMCSWGLLINYGVETMEEYPWLLIFPGAALSITLFSLNFLGDGLRDALDPKSTRR
jgi:oligopeptide transport system permease protein